MGRWSSARRGPATASTAKTAALSLAGQAELLRLRKEDGQLHMGREMLKKAAAFPSASFRTGFAQGNRIEYGCPGATEDLSSDRRHAA